MTPELYVKCDNMSMTFAQLRQKPCVNPLCCQPITKGVISERAACQQAIQRPFSECHIITIMSESVQLS